MTNTREVIISEELCQRVARIQSELKKHDIDALLVGSNVNLFYVAGQVLNGFVYIPKEGAAIKFIRRPKGMVGDDICYIRKPEEMPTELEKRGYAKPTKLAMEADSLTYSEYMRVASGFPDSTIVNGSSVLRNVRAVKSPYELSLMRESGVKHAMMYAEIPNIYKSGMTDLELSAGIESVARSLGSLGLFRIAGSSMEIFMGSVLAGDNADAPSPYDFALGGAGQNSSLPIGANGTVLKPGMCVMVDMGSNFTGYMTDMSRVYGIGEVKDETAIRAHKLSIDIQNEIASVAKPGVEAKALYEIALNMVNRENLAHLFMGHKQQAGFMGHGLGIEINELPVLAPRSRDILVEGMAFAMEPKFVIPGVGAVGTENTYCVTSTGLERLTHFEENICILE